MMHVMSKTAPRLSHVAYIVFATLALLIPSARANAQNDAARVLADRVLDAASGRSRDGVYRNDGIYRRDDDRIYRRNDDRRWEYERYERERREFARKCRTTSSNSRQCRDLPHMNSTYGRGGDWCRDRDRNGRCDARSNARVDHRNDRGRGGWLNEHRR